MTQIIKSDRPYEIAQQADKAKRIKDETDQKIRTSLLKVFFLVGLNKKHHPEKEERMLLLSYLKTNFGNYSLVDLEGAFILGIKGKLQEKDQKGAWQPIDMKHYQDFSIPYLERVMQAYTAYMKTLRDLNNRSITSDQRQLNEAPNKMSHDEIIENHVSAYKRFMNKRPYLDLGGRLFKRLYEAGMLYKMDEQGEPQTDNKGNYKFIDMQDLSQQMKSYKGKKGNDGGLQEFMQKLSAKKAPEDTDSEALADAKLHFLTQHFRLMRKWKYSVEDYRALLKQKVKEDK